MKKKIIILLISMLVFSLMPAVNADTLTLRPNATGNIFQLTPYGDSPNWKCVDEDGDHDGFTTYVANDHTGIDRYDLYNFDNAIPNGLINKITTFTVSSHDGGGGGWNWLRHLLFIDGSLYYSDSGIQVYPGWQMDYFDWFTNPHTGNPWTWDEINNIQAGPKMYQHEPGQAMYMTQMWIDVDYLYTLPEIIDNTPSTGYTGDAFTFNATITDIDGIDSAWVTWWYHEQTAITTELENTNGDFWETTITIEDTLDLLFFNLSANDTFNNWQTTDTRYVTICDNDFPEIENIQANPEIQIVGRNVNISAEVTDNIEVQSVYVHLRYPDAFEEDINITQNKIGDTYSLNQTYNQEGEHRYSFQATDTSGNIITSDTLMFFIRGNEPPSAPLISGPSSGQAGEEYTYLFSTAEPDLDNIYYSVFWGDGDVEEWLGPYESGETIELSHTWEEQDTYTISARAMDVWGDIGEWGTLEVEMPVNQFQSTQQIPRFMQSIIERYPILRQVLGL